MAGKNIDSAGALEPLLEGDALRAAFRRRRDENEYAKIPFDQENKFIQGGWIVHKRTQSHLWMKTQKHPEVILEDRVWCLLYRMGYPRLSGPKFSVLIQSGSSGSDAKRISVMAIDDETAVVVECRARQHRGRRSFQKEIEEFEACKRKISSAKREHSRKPDELYDLIESCSPGPYLELFARGTRAGWTAWGNQADDNYTPTWKTYANHSQARLIAAE
jgi:MT-A70